MHKDLENRNILLIFVLYPNIKDMAKKEIDTTSLYIATHNIKLYRDEFKYNDWKSYCKILGVSPSSEVVFVPFPKKMVVVLK